MITGRQHEFLVERFLDISHHRLHVSSSNIDTDIDTPRSLITRNLHRSRLVRDVCHLREWDLLPGRRIDKEVLEIVDAFTILVTESDDEVEALFSLEDDTRRRPRKSRTDITVELLDIEPILSQAGTVVTDRDLRQTSSTLECHIARSRHLTDNAYHLLAKSIEFIQVLAIELHRHILANTREQLVETQRHRLGERKVQTGERLELGFDLLDKFFLRLRRGPFATVLLQNDETVGIVEAHWIRRDIRHTDARTDRLDLRKTAEQQSLHLFLPFDGL